MGGGHAGSGCWNRCARCFALRLSGIVEESRIVVLVVVIVVVVVVVV